METFQRMMESTGIGIGREETFNGSWNGSAANMAYGIYGNIALDGGIVKIIEKFKESNLITNNYLLTGGHL